VDEEVKSVFGFLTHYTDVGNLAIRKCQLSSTSLLSVPEVKWIFEPLQEIWPIYMSEEVAKLNTDLGNVAISKRQQLSSTSPWSVSARLLH
jgi:hypothetical protein